MQDLTKIPEYSPISNPFEQQGLVSNSRMSHPPYHERRSLNMFLTSFYGDGRFSRLQDPHGIRGPSAPTSLVANDLRRVAFLVRFKVDDNCDVAPVGGGGGGGELGGAAIFL